jgi:acyl-CoA dehydrogenase
MSELRALLADTAAKVFRGIDAKPDALFGHGWDRVAEAGLPGLMVREDKGGFGAGFEDALVVFREVGACALALPVCEAIIANRLLDDSGCETGNAPTTIAVKVNGTLTHATGGLRFSGALHGVPWGRDAEHIAAIVAHEGEPHVVLLSRQDASQLTRHENIAGEPRDDLHFVSAPLGHAAPSNRSSIDLIRMGALLRVGQMAGALDHALAMTLEHAKTRQQFGRAISNYQAIQQQLAVFASETAAIGCAAASASRASDRGPAAFEIAAAKLRANRAVDLATSIAHEVHGAIGITREHALRRYTQRLWAWKSEFGNDRFWAMRLGAEAASRGADLLWHDLTARAAS